MSVRLPGHICVSVCLSVCLPACLPMCECTASVVTVVIPQHVRLLTGVERAEEEEGGRVNGRRAEGPEEYTVTR